MIKVKKNKGKWFYGLAVRMIFLPRKKYYETMEENTDQFVCIKVRKLAQLKTQQKKLNGHTD